LWELPIRETTDWPVFGDHHFDGTYKVTWKPGWDIAISGNLGDQTMETSSTAGTNDPQVGVFIRTHGEQAAPSVQGVHAPISEDTTCPDNN
jgi:hypothetical protein